MDSSASSSQQTMMAANGTQIGILPNGTVGPAAPMPIAPGSPPALVTPTSSTSAAIPSNYATPAPSVIATSANSPGSAKAAVEVSKLVSVMNGTNIQGMFSEYDAYRAYQKGGRKGAKPATSILDATRVKLAPIDLQAAFKGLAMISGKNYTRTTPGAPFAVAGPAQGFQTGAVKAKNKAVGLFGRMFTRGLKGGKRRSSTTKRRTLKRRS